MRRCFAPGLQWPRVCAAALLFASAPFSVANAETPTAAIPRSDSEAALGVLATGSYVAATTLWVSSLLSDARFEYRLLPSLALGAAAAWGLASYDSRHPFRTGVLANTVSGATVGLAIGTAWVLHNRAGSTAWGNRTASTLLWAGATVGAGIGALSSRAGTTPGRAAFTTAASLWTATATGLLAASLGNVDTAERRGFLAAAVSMEAGVIAAGWLGRRWPPSVRRVLWASSSALVGAAAVATGTWLVSDRPQLQESRVTWGAAAVGLMTGGVAGWCWP